MIITTIEQNVEHKNSLISCPNEMSLSFTNLSFPLSDLWAISYYQKSTKIFRKSFIT